MAEPPTPQSTLRARLHALFGVDLRSLAVLRVSLALLILVDLALRLPFLEAMYTDTGVWPREAVAPTGPLFAFHLLSGTAGFQAALFGLTAGFALALGVGHWTRLACVACWLLVTSLQLRHEPFLDGGDSLLRALLFWGMFAPLGERWSLDARDRPPPGAPPSRVSVGSVALLLQFVFLYCFAGLLKTADTWADGTAIELALRWEDRSGPLAGLLLAWPGLLSALTPAVRWFEIVGPLLLFVPVRTAEVRLLVLGGFAAMQLGFGLSIQLQLFPWVSAAAAVPFLPPLFWDAIGRRSVRRRTTRDAASPRPRRRWAGWLRGFGGAIVALLLVYAFAANLHSLGAVRLPRGLRAAAEVLAIHQAWTLFAPGPPTWNAGFEVYGQLADGSAVDLMRADAAPGWERVRSLQRSVRFRNHLERMVRPPRPEPGARHYLRWLCRRWNADARGERRLERVRMLFTRELLIGPPEPTRRFRLRELECPKG